MTINFGTKAETLMALDGVVKSASISKLLVINYSDWQSHRKDLIERIRQNFGTNLLIVRSSSFDEDALTKSNAGAFKSLLNVSISGAAKAIDDVFSSYTHIAADSQVLIQAMLKDVVRSGVAFSHDANSGAAYICINWSDGIDTEAVTSGNRKVRYCQISSSAKVIPTEHKQVFELVTEVYQIMGMTPIDIEFALTKSEGGLLLWLLQARPLILSLPAETVDDHSIRLDLLQSHLTQAFKRQPFLFGDKTFFGVMPDWNPAEIIGLRPRPLALSLYRELITDAIWAYQRNNYGYRNLRSFPLLKSLHGLPYVDVRVSFNSFIPADLDDLMAEKLANFYLQKLEDSPELHDKVEFEIVCSCYTFDIKDKFNDFKAHGFDEKSLKVFAESLRKLTNNILHPEKGLWRTDKQKINKLIARRSIIIDSDLDTAEKIYWLIEDTKRYGTLPFAGLARAGFIAVQLLHSLNNIGVFTKYDVERFMSSISTVTTSLGSDRSLNSKQEFLKTYGHLRPGTYDILSPRYDVTPDEYFDWSIQVPFPEEKKEFTLTITQLSEIKNLLSEHKINADPVQLIEFIQSAISLREYAKFEFTKNLSDCLELFALLGEQNGFSREDLSFSNAQIIKELYVGSFSPKDLFERSIEKGKMDHELAQKTSLPPFITSNNDIWAFEWPETQPNFVTLKSVTAPVVNLESSNDLTGKIVCIRGADPGYDWIFSRDIGGLLTCWGGANSHMSIRAGELGLPAVIGVGELDYNRYSSARKLHIDCSNKVIQILG
jgi:glutamine kinase